MAKDVKKKILKDTTEKAPKFGVVTTFPNWATDVYGKKFLESFCAHMPKDVSLFISLDPDDKQKDTIAVIEPILVERLKAGTCLTRGVFMPEQAALLERHKDVKPVKDYRFDYKRFSYKIFSLYDAVAVAKEEGIDYLVWMDADIVITQDITNADLLKWMPEGKQAISYLGRKDWDHSECGFMGFNLNNSNAVAAIDRIFKMYCTDEVLTLAQWHDSFVFDTIWKDMDKKNLSEGIEGRDVFEKSLLGSHMIHNKGKRKFGHPSEIPELVKAPLANKDQIFVDELPIRTKNCVDHEIITKHVSENLRLITEWLDYCPANDEEIAICSAGESFNPYEAKLLFSDKGIKILAVKSVLKRLLDHGVKPWACILLDPRDHVKEYIKDVPKDIIFFVASMVDPEATKLLIQNGNTVIGYHAFVNAGEDKLVPRGQLFVPGGSATSTRGIDVMQLLGFKTFHLYGYDLCAMKKPDLTLKKDNGKFIWEEITLSEKSYGGYVIQQTFWTKGEFLAQVQELKKMYLPQKSFQFHIYGDGLVPWMYKHMCLYNQWVDAVAKQKQANLDRFAKNVNEWIDDKRSRSLEADQGWPEHRVVKPSRKAG